MQLSLEEKSRPYTTINTHRGLRNLNEVLSRLEKAGVRLKKEKCVFLTPRVEYLGHLIDSEGLHPTLTKVRAILNAPSPTNVTQLKSFLGIINYYRKFLPDLSSKLFPLNSLLQKNSRWNWGPNKESAFKKAKQSLTDVHVLVHFDPQKELV